jgi:hypothetical protein
MSALEISSMVEDTAAGAGVKPNDEPTATPATATTAQTPKNSSGAPLLILVNLLMAQNRSV